MHFEVVCGQQLDLLGHENVSLVHDLKTGSYTVRGPLCLGALLADASREQLVALERFGAPLGLAFQLRDDLLSTFGTTSAIGKPVGNDLRAGKRTALVAEALRVLSPGDRAALEAVLGHPDASDRALAAATDLLVRSGVRDRAEERIQSLLADAARALEAGKFSEHGRALLLDLAQKLSLRQR
jgi:geranylgeranyl diphosphate synthase, type I